MDQVLELKNIHYTYHTLDGETPALTDISFSLNKGEFVAIVGPSGCGKSTLLSLIAGLITPEKGLIKINGKYLRESTTNIGYMLQHDELFEWRTIYHNVLLGLEVQHMLSAKTKARAHELLEIYGLKNFENSHPSELSGGMRQRAALIRTLVLEPDILLLDEPFSALDYQTDARLRQALRERYPGITTVIAAQRVSSIMAASLILVLENGRITGAGRHEELLERCPVYRDIYQSQMGDLA